MWDGGMVLLSTLLAPLLRYSIGKSGLSVWRERPVRSRTSSNPRPPSCARACSSRPSGGRPSPPSRRAKSHAPPIRRLMGQSPRAFGILGNGPPSVPGRRKEATRWTLRAEGRAAALPQLRPVVGTAPIPLTLTRPLPAKKHACTLAIPLLLLGSARWIRETKNSVWVLKISTRRVYTVLELAIGLTL